MELSSCSVCWCSKVENKKTQTWFFSFWALATEFPAVSVSICRCSLAGNAVDLDILERAHPTMDSVRFQLENDSFKIHPFSSGSGSLSLTEKAMTVKSCGWTQPSALNPLDSAPIALYALVQPYLYSQAHIAVTSAIYIYMCTYAHTLTQIWTQSYTHREHIQDWQF